MANAIQLTKLNLLETKRFLFLIGIIAVYVLVIETSMLSHNNGFTYLVPDFKVSSHGESTLHTKVSLEYAKTGSVSFFNGFTNSSVALEMVKNTKASNMKENMQHDSETKGQMRILKNAFASKMDHRLAFKVHENKSLDDESSSNKLINQDIEEQGKAFLLHKDRELGHGFSLASKKATETVSKDAIPNQLQTGSGTSNTSMLLPGHPVARKMRCNMPPKTIMPMIEMNRLLFRRRGSYHSVKPQWSSIRDRELLSAKVQIENAPNIRNDRELYDPLFRNVSMFKKSYELMERMLKVYIYKDGAKPIFHLPILKGIYASEGWFMKLMEGKGKFVVKDPRKAHLFYMPFSTRMLEHTLYVRNSHNRTNLVQYLKNYTFMIAAKYPFWNRTYGADHFFVACHDWAPYETRHHMERCIKSLCNADVTAGFKIGKDVSLPETYVRSARNPQRDIGGKPASERAILAFFAGSMHGYLRPVLLSHWKNKDPDMKIFGPMPPGVASKMNYINHMKSSKYCICAKGYEVNSPRVVEAIFYECVPVIISDNFVPPFFEVLDWEAFSVIVPEKDIPMLKKILLSIPQDKYIEMQLRVKKVRRHFVWHSEPVKYDLFHMILHSIWYNRVFMMKSR